MEFDLRHRICVALRATSSPELHAFADAIVAREGDRMACWGNLADHIVQKLMRDEQLIALGDVLIDVGERRSLLLFLDLVRDRPVVLSALFEDVERLSPFVQCALVSLTESGHHLEPTLPRLCAAARELARADDKGKTRERAIYQAHMSALRSQRAATFTSSTPTEASEVHTEGVLS